MKLTFKGENIVDVVHQIASFLESVGFSETKPTYLPGMRFDEMAKETYAQACREHPLMASQPNGIGSLPAHVAHDVPPPGWAADVARKTLAAGLNPPDTPFHSKITGEYYGPPMPEPTTIEQVMQNEYRRGWQDGFNESCDRATVNAAPTSAEVLVDALKAERKKW